MYHRDHYVCFTTGKNNHNFSFSILYVALPLDVWTSPDYKMYHNEDRKDSALMQRQSIIESSLC